MSGRSLLNVVEASLLDGLDADSRVRVRWQIHDPAGFAADQQTKTAEALIDAGGEIG